MRNKNDFVERLVNDNSPNQGHSGRFIDAERYSHGNQRVNRSHRGREKSREADLDKLCPRPGLLHLCEAGEWIRHDAHTTSLSLSFCLSHAHTRVPSFIFSLNLYPYFLYVMMRIYVRNLSDVTAVTIFRFAIINSCSLAITCTLTALVPN